MGVVRLILRYIFITLALAIVGIQLTDFKTLASSDGQQISTFSIIGMILFFFSPLLSAMWLWLPHRKAKTAKDKIENYNIAEQTRRHLFLENQRLNKLAEQNRKDFLRRRFLERQRLIDSVDRHNAALKRNLDRAIKKNDYDALVADTRNEALEEFFASIDLDMDILNFNDAAEIVFEQLDIRENKARDLGFDSSNLPHDGHAFERWVAEALVGFGWEAKVTSGSGDQGIDVLAEMNGKKLGLQCKLYNSPIGNKAVQEAHAGKAYYGLEVVGVLSNASYTRSAEDLATMTGVRLLSHQDIPDLFDKVFPK